MSKPESTLYFCYGWEGLGEILCIVLTSEVRLISCIISLEQILGMLEGCSTEEIEDRMKVLAQRHLVISRCGTDDRCQNYWLHDLVYDYLMSEDAARDKVF